MDISVQYVRVFSVCVQVIVSGAAGSSRDVAVFSACTLSAAGSGQSPGQADRAGQSAVQADSSGQSPGQADSAGQSAGRADSSGQPEDGAGQREDGAGQREDGAVEECLRWLIEHEFVR